MRIADPGQSVELLRPYGSHTLPPAGKIRPGALDPCDGERGVSESVYCLIYQGKQTVSGNEVSCAYAPRTFLNAKTLHSLAYAEIYLSLAHIARRFDFELYETTTDNICVYRDMGIGCPKIGLFGVRATVVGLVEE